MELKIDEEVLREHLSKGWKPYYHKAVKRWYLRKGQERKIVPRELEGLVSSMKIPVSRIFVDAREYREIREKLERALSGFEKFRSEFERLRSELERFREGEVDWGLCPSCNKPVKLKEVRDHMAHVRVVEKTVEKPVVVEKTVEKPRVIERVVEKVVEKPSPELEMRARRAEEERERLRREVEELRSRGLQKEREAEGLRQEVEKLRSREVQGELVMDFITRFEQRMRGKVGVLERMISYEVTRDSVIRLGSPKKAAEKVVDYLISEMKEKWKEEFGPIHE